MTTNQFLANVRLNGDTNVIPKLGLMYSPLRVELSIDQKMETTWIAEIKVLGPLPWHRGEERKVEIRIMSSEFYSYVNLEYPNLLVCRDGEIIGDLKFEQSR